MPIGPTGQPPLDRTQDVPESKSIASNAQSNAQARGAFQAPGANTAESATAAPTAAKLATQLVQDARSAGTSGSIATPLGDLVKAVTSQMGMPELPQEQRQQLVSTLADDPVVKNLIG